MVVGTVSNISTQLLSNLDKVIKAVNAFELTHIYLVESDSTDSTIEILRELGNKIVNFDYISLGNLKDDIPDRISRIRFCRNVYVARIRKIIEETHLDYIVVADLDGMNSKISSKAFNSSFVRKDWGAVLANQTGGYYDLLALRHPKWCPDDVFKELQTQKLKIDKTPLPSHSFIRRLKRRLEYDRTRQEVIYSKMKRIKKSDEWIEVQSAFGGLGIYKAEIFAKFDYSLLEDDQDFESEHVAISKRIIEYGEKIFINPRMINNHFNTYNVNRFFVIRQIRDIYWNSVHYRSK